MTALELQLTAAVRYQDEVIRQRRAVIREEQRKREERLWTDDELRDVHEQITLLLEEQQ